MQQVLQFLVQDGYVETARAFADEIHEDRSSLNISQEGITNGLDVKEDENAGHRQREYNKLPYENLLTVMLGIRAAILEGDIDRAIKHTNAYYPSLLKEHENIYFQLRCRKFIEMIGRAAEMRPGADSGTIKSGTSNGNSSNWYDTAVGNEMEIDGGADADQENKEVLYNNALTDTIEYGKVLEAEFAHDVKRETQKALKEAYSLMAYEDPFNAPDVSHLLASSGRVALAEELNSAILS